MKKKLVTFIITLSLWFAFVGRVNIQVFLLGTIICSLITLLFADTIFRLVQIKYESRKSFLKIYYMFLLISAFIYDVFSSAVRISKHAFEIKPSFSTRIVRIKTSLENINSVAMLANFITLPQGTLAIDLDILNSNYFIHCLDVHRDDEAEIRKTLICKHERLIAKIFD